MHLLGNGLISCDAWLPIFLWPVCLLLVLLRLIVCFPIFFSLLLFLLSEVRLPSSPGRAFFFISLFRVSFILVRQVVHLLLFCRLFFFLLQVMPEDASLLFALGNSFFFSRLFFFPLAGDAGGCVSTVCFGRHHTG